MKTSIEPEEEEEEEEEGFVRSFKNKEGVC